RAPAPSFDIADSVSRVIAVLSWNRLANPAARIAAHVRMILLARQNQVVQVIRARGSPRLFASTLHRTQEQRDECADDGNEDETLGERKATTVALHLPAPFVWAPAACLKMRLPPRQVGCQIVRCVKAGCWRTLTQHDGQSANISRTWRKYKRNTTLRQ